MSHLKPIAADYIDVRLEVKPRSRLHRLVARLMDTHMDDLSEEEIARLEAQIDNLRITHASGERFAT